MTKTCKPNGQQQNWQQIRIYQYNGKVYTC